MPTREEMIAHIQAAQSAQQPQAPKSREEMISFIQNQANQSVRQPQQVPKDSGVVVAARNAAQGYTGGFSDEIAGGVEAAGRVVGLKGLGVGDIRNLSFSSDGPTLNPEKIKQAYRDARNQEQGDLKTDMKERPGLATTANIATSLFSPINKLAKGASLLKGGALIGGVNALGASEAEDLTGLVKDTATGALTGAAVGGVVGKASEKLKGAGEKLSAKTKDLAEKFAARSLGAERGTINKLGAKNVQNAGRQALDKGIITSLGNTEGKIAANEALKQGAIADRAASYQKIDKAGASTFNPLEVATKVEEKIIGNANKSFDDTKEAMQALKPHIDNILSRGDGNITMEAAQDLVESFGKKAKFDTSRSSLANDTAKQVYRVVRESINEAADKSANKVGGESLKKGIEKANQTYASGMTATKLLKNKLAREQGNNILGLTDAITGAGSLGYGATTGDWGTAAAVIGGKKVLQKYGTQNAALALDKISKSLAGSPALAKVAQNNPRIIQAIVSTIEAKSSRLPRAAEQRQGVDGGSSVASIKGENKWAVDGYAKVLEQDGSFENEAFISKALSNPKSKKLLVQASMLTPGSKQMANIITQLKQMDGQ